MFTSPTNRTLIVLAKNEAIAEHLRSLRGAIGRELIIVPPQTFEQILATGRFEAAVLCLGAEDIGPVVASVRQVSPTTPVIVIGDADRARPAVMAIRSGALSYLPHPVEAAELRDILDGFGDTPETQVELSLAVAERKAIERALLASRGNVKRAAETLGIARATLYRKMARFGMRQPAGAPQAEDAPS